MYFSCTLCKECTTGNIKHVLGLTNFWSHLKQFHGARKWEITGQWILKAAQFQTTRIVGHLQQHHNLQHVWSSTTWILGLWIHIPIRAWMCVCISSVFMLSCVSTCFVTGQCPIQGVLPNIYKQDLGSEIWCVHMILQHTDNYLPSDTVAFPRITKSMGFRKVYGVLGCYTTFVGRCLPVFQDSSPFFFDCLTLEGGTDLPIKAT